MANQTPAVVMDKYVTPGELRHAEPAPPASASVTLSPMIANTSNFIAARGFPS
jgi:hypothetical protein